MELFGEGEELYTSAILIANVSNVLAICAEFVTHWPCMALLASDNLSRGETPSVHPLVAHRKII